MWAPLLSKATIGGQEAQVDIITIVYKKCLENPTGPKDFQWIITTLYKLDILDDETIVSWYQSKINDTVDENDDDVCNSLCTLVEWILQIDEED